MQGAALAPKEEEEETAAAEEEDEGDAGLVFAERLRNKSKSVVFTPPPVNATLVAPRASPQLLAQILSPDELTRHHNLICTLHASLRVVLTVSRRSTARSSPRSRRFSRLV